MIRSCRLVRASEAAGASAVPALPPLRAVLSLALLLVPYVATAAAQEAPLTSEAHVLSERQRPAVINRALQERLELLLPEVMREAGIDMWLVINREYAEDPVYFTLVPAPVYAARRTTMLVFHDRGEKEGVDRLTVNRYPFGSLYEPAWEGGDLDAQWQGLADVIVARDPQTIGVNVSRDWPVADGLTASLHERLLAVLPETHRDRVVSAEEVAVRWLETRSPLEIDLYPQIVGLARGVLAEAFSNDVITPGATSAADIEWFIAQRFAELDLQIWFQPSVDIQRRELECADDSPFCGRGGDEVVRRGDVLHTDIGICYLRLCTDTQEMGYVLRPGEVDVPDELKEALAVGNRWQDILTGSFAAGKTGNQILGETIRQAEAEGIRSSTYTHPLGFFGHAPGPTIGMWDNQGETPIRGDWLVHRDTAYSIEGNVRVEPPSWQGNPVVIKLEQDALFDGSEVRYIAGRQTEWLVIK